MAESFLSLLPMQRAIISLNMNPSMWQQNTAFDTENPLKQESNGDVYEHSSLPKTSQEPPGLKLQGDSLLQMLQDFLTQYFASQAADPADAGEGERTFSLASAKERGVSEEARQRMEHRSLRGWNRSHSENKCQRD